jgi:hypothetical protein
MPTLTDEQVVHLAGAHRELVTELAAGKSFDASFQSRLDDVVATTLRLPQSLVDAATDLVQERLKFNKGVVPDSAKMEPRQEDLYRYASRLAGELDGFIAGRGRHRVTILHGKAGICASIEITSNEATIPPVIVDATGEDARTLRRVLAAAEEKFAQWVYMKRSIRFFDGNTLQLIKPPRRCEWTEGRALLDAGDVIAEIAARKR